jgi:hypothetical protein
VADTFSVLIFIMLAHFVSACYRAVHFDFVGRQAIRLCCTAFLAGAGLDDAAVEVIQRMGPDGIRLLRREAEHPARKMIASLILKMLDAADGGHV